MGAEKREIWMDRRKQRKDAKDKLKAEKKHDKKTKFFKGDKHMELPSTNRSSKNPSEMNHDTVKVNKPNSRR